MKKLIYLLILLMGACTWGDAIDDQGGLPGTQIVKFKLQNPSFRLHGPPDSRILTTSEWIHILPEDVEIEITNLMDMGVQKIPLNLKNPQGIRLKNGSYMYSGQSATSDLSDFLPITFAGTFIVKGADVSIEILPNYTHGLITVKNQLVDEIAIDGSPMAFSNNFHYLYAIGGKSISLQIKESVYGTTINQPVNPVSGSHFNYILELEDGEFDAGISVIMEPFAYEENLIIISKNKTRELYPGDTISLVAVPNSGFSFTYWTEDGNIVGYDSVIVYVMPDRDVNITANFSRM